MKYSFLSLFLLPHLALACGLGEATTWGEWAVIGIFTLAILCGVVFLGKFLLTRKQHLLFVLLLCAVIVVCESVISDAVYGTCGIF